VRQYLVSVGSPLGAAAAVPVIARGLSGPVRLHSRPHGAIDSARFWASWSHRLAGLRSRRARALATR